MGPERRFGRSLTAQEVSDQLDNLISAHTLRRLARQGRVPGAFQLGGKYYFAPNTALWLVRDLSTTSPAGYTIRAPKEGSTVDGYVQPPR